MKKTFLIFSILSSGLIYSQIERGTFLLGPSFNYSQNGNNNQPEDPTAYTQSGKSGAFNSALRLGYFVTNNIAVGVLGGYGSSFSNGESKNSSSVNPGYVQKSNSTINLSSFGLFARTYKLFNENRFGFFCQLDGVYQIGNSKTTYTDDQSGVSQSSNTNGNVTGINLGLRPGVVYFITKRIGIEGMVGNLSYNHQTQQNYSNGQKTSKNSTNTLNTNFGLNSFYLGVNFYFGGKKP